MYLIILPVMVIGFFVELVQGDTDSAIWALAALLWWVLAFTNLYRARRAKKDSDWLGHVVGMVTRKADRRSYFV